MDKNKIYWFENVFMAFLVATMILIVLFPDDYFKLVMVFLNLGLLLVWIKLKYAS